VRRARLQTLPSRGTDGEGNAAASDQTGGCPHGDRHIGWADRDAWQTVVVAAGHDHDAFDHTAVLVHETRKYIGAYSAVLEGLDILAFTGGIGENGIRIRQSVCQGLEYLGIRVDPDRNQVRGRDTVISADGSQVSVLVILANEELVIARETARLVAESG